ncbi:NUDIX domain-containing protein [Methanoregula sp.]|uniref:NUDIX domain-containing protein n=1 Tax=Methanoregula sp. TaxID=2052170 RepID=UPI003449D681
MITTGAYDRRRGTAIVDTSKGILVVRQGIAPFLLPGGGTKNNESRIEAAIRELREETGLIAYEVKYLFTFHQSKVFLIQAEGIPKPRHEISQIGYYSLGSSLPVSHNTKKIIEMYCTREKS